MAEEGGWHKQSKVRIEKSQIIVGICVGIVCVLFSMTDFYQIQRLKVFDEMLKTRNRVFGLPVVDPDVAMVEVDDRALATEGRWQDWTRDKFAGVVDALAETKARMVGFDVFFPEASPRVVRLETVTEELGDRSQIPREDVLRVFKDYDEVFAESIRNAGNVYLGQTFEVVEEGVPFGEIKKRSASIDERFRAMHAFYRDFPAWKDTRIKRCVSLDSPPLKQHIEAVRGVGFVQTVPDIDGTRRRYQLLMVYDGKLVPSIVVLMLCDYLQVPFSSLQLPPEGGLVFPKAHMPDGRVMDLKVPMDPDGRMYVNWVGKQNEGFRRYSHSVVVSLAESQRYLRAMKKIIIEEPSLLQDPEAISSRMKSVGLKNEPAIEEGFRYLSMAGAVEAALIADIRLNAREFLKGVGLEEGDISQSLLDLVETVRANLAVATLLEKAPNLTLEQVLERTKGLADPKLTAVGFHALKRMVSQGGIKPEDHPLYFSPSISVGDRDVVPDELAGKVVFYGLTATGTHDLNPTPFDPAYPLLGIHANAFNTIVTQRFIRPIPSWATALIMVGLALLVGIVVPLFSAATTAGIIIGVMLAYVSGVFLAFAKTGIWIGIVGPVTALLLTYLAITLYSYIEKEKEKNFVEGAFGRFLAPSVVEQIVEHPEMLTQLGGEERVMTAFFSDVKGFSTVSQKLTPQQLVELLNEYLTTMVEVIEEHGGTIDKFEGDAIIAFYGAPIHYPDHPQRACLAAVAMQEKLAEMREQWKRDGKQLLYVRMGMNTGPMVVGNMGSNTRVDYTIMGDTVNIAARFEPACKVYGVYTMIGDRTYEGAREVIEARELDRLIVVGRSEPVTTYEILSRKGALDPKTAEVVGIYSEGLGLYRSRRWDEAISSFQKALALDPRDGPSSTYIGRCEAFKLRPPPDDWKGDFSQTEK